MENANLILPISTCRSNMQMIQDTMEQPVLQEPNALMDRISEYASLLATSAQTMSSIKFHLSDALGQAIEQAFRDKYPPSMAKTFAEGRCAELLSDYELSNRQNAALTHAMDGIRSILSFTKQELYNSNLQR